MSGMMNGVLGVVMIIAGIVLFYYRHRYDRKCSVPVQGVCSFVTKSQQIERKLKDGTTVSRTVESTTLHFKYDYKTRSFNNKLFSAFGMEYKFFGEGEFYDLLVNPANPMEFVVSKKGMREHLEKGSLVAYTLVSNFFDFVLSVILIGAGATFALV